MDTAAEYIYGALAVAVIALCIAIAHHIGEAIRRRRLRRIAEQADEWISSLAVPTTPQTPADAGDPRHPASAGSNRSAAP